MEEKRQVKIQTRKERMKEIFQGKKDTTDDKNLAIMEDLIQTSEPAERDDMQLGT